MDHIFRFFKKLNSFLIILEKTVLVFILFSMIVLSFGQILLREIFNITYTWITPFLSKVEVLWIVFIGAALATEYRQHIKIDFLANIIKSETTKKNIALFSQMFALIVCSVLFFLSIDYVNKMYEYHSVSIIPSLGLPDWCVLAIIPYSFLVMSSRCIYNIFKIVDGDQAFVTPAGESDTCISND